MLLTTTFRLFSLVRQVVLPARFPGLANYLQRLVAISLLLPPFLALQILHWLGFLLDEILFSDYRQINIKKPVFVLGVPRSGTTFTHRLLARDGVFTTLSTWECLFAPSITQRYVFLTLRKVDQLLGGLLGHAMSFLEKGAFSFLDDVHPMSLSDAEEDYLVLMPLLCCFVLILPFPEARWLWRMGCFDRDVPAHERHSIMRWYRRCLQKHLYVHGHRKTLLSKNASFAGMAISLGKEFPDARLIVCERDAMQTIGSQFNSLQGSMDFFGIPRMDPAFRQHLVETLLFYYQNLDRLLDMVDSSSTVRVFMRSLSAEPRLIVERIYSMLDRPLPELVDEELRRHETRNKQHTPLATPKLSTWGLREDELARSFAPWLQAVR